MMKILLPLLLAGIVVIAGIFAFMPIDMATTVHSTLQSSSATTTQTGTIQGTQLNNVDTVYDTDLSTNATAGCGASGGDFLVHYVFSNSSTSGEGPAGLTQLGWNNLTSTGGTDFVVSLLVGNETSIAGTVGAATGETITFFGNSSGASLATGESSLHDTGELALTVVCRSGSTPAVSTGD